jgi:peroxiredoxin
MTTASSRRPRRGTPRPGARQPRPGRQGHLHASRPGPGRAAPGQARSRLTAEKQRRARRRARLHAAGWLAAITAVAGLIIATVLASGSGSGTAQTSAVRAAPGFTLSSTAGRNVSLASYRGRDVVLYFSEGTGCDACFYQMREFENHAAELTRAGITVVPIVMNPASQIRAEMAAFGVRTPYLIDATGSVSRAYGVLGKGMHAGLPGHGFVLVDARGTERWHGEYPSMYLSAAGLITQVKAHP